MKPTNKKTNQECRKKKRSIQKGKDKNVRHLQDLFFGQFQHSNISDECNVLELAHPKSESVEIDYLECQGLPKITA